MPLLALMILLGTVLRILSLNSGLWYDEITTLLDSVRPPLAQIVTHFPGSNDHRLYSIMAHAAVAAFGEHPWSLRLPAVLFGIATIPMLYIFGTQVTSRLEAFLAAALLAVSYHHVWFSQNARGYTLLLFLTLLATHQLLAALIGGSRSAYLRYAVAAALGAYAHLTMVLVVVGHGLVIASRLLMARRLRIVPADWIDPFLGFGLAALLTVTLYAPVLLDIQALFARVPQQVNVAPTSWALWETLRHLQIGFASAGAAVLVTLLLMAGCWSYLRQSSLILALFILPGLVTVAAAVMLHHPVRPRFVFFLGGFALLITVRGAMTTAGWIARDLSHGRSGRALAALLPLGLIGSVAVASAIALAHGYRYPKQDFEQAMRYVEAHQGADDAVVVAGGGAALPYQRYYHKPWQKVESVAELSELRDEHAAVWLLYTFPSYLEAAQPALMSEITTNCIQVRSFSGTLSGGEVVVNRCG